jgi:NAD(P)-dependent dehydrogenase (short-subunit alcohol dehydrogenase family)
MSQAVLITGASSGFGRLTAETLAGRGHTVYATMRDVETRNAAAAAQLTAAARAAGWALHVLELDVTDDASVRSAVGRAIELGGLDVVVNNAGYNAMGLAEGFADAQVQAIFDTHVVGAHRVVRAALPHLRSRGRGLLVAVSTTMAAITIPFAAPYTAAKRALEGLAESWRYELAPLGVDSVIVEPGGFLTPLWGKSMTPADSARLATYGPLAEAPAKVFGGFKTMLETGNGPSPQVVADAIARLIETPAGARPLRTVVDPFFGDAARAIDATTGAVTQQSLAAVGLGDLVGIKPA